MYRRRWRIQGEEEGGRKYERCREKKDESDLAVNIRGTRRERGGEGWETRHVGGWARYFAVETHRGPHFSWFSETIRASEFQILPRHRVFFHRMTCDRRSRISSRNDSHPSANRAISTGKHLSRQRSHFNTYLSSYLSLSLCLSSYSLARILRFILRLMILDGRRSVKGEGCRHVAHLLLNLSPCNSPLKLPRLTVQKYLKLRSSWNVSKALIFPTRSIACFDRNSYSLSWQMIPTSHSCAFLLVVRRFVDRIPPIKARFVISWAAAHWATASRENNDPTPPGSFRGPFVAP